MTERDDRQILAVLVADVAGYSRLVTIDVSGTEAELRRNQELLAAAVVDFGGYVVNTAGDGLLAAFPSVVRALECALDVQQAVSAIAAQHVAGQGAWLRIGINIGEVIKRDGRISGDAVSIAARMATVADPGSVVVSTTAHEQLRGKVQCSFEELGQITTKAIDNPPRIYLVRRRVTGSVDREEGVTGGLKVFGPLSAWSRDTSLNMALRTQVAAEARVFVSVQKFSVLGRGIGLEKFAAALEEDMMSELSDDREITLRDERGEADPKADERDVARAGHVAGTRLMLSGSLQQRGSSLRVQAKLVDLETGEHVWSENYDGDTSIDFQTAVSGLIASAVRLKLVLGKFNLRDRAPPDGPEVREIVNRAIVCFFEQTKDSVTEAVRLSERALAIDPASIRGRRTLTSSISASITFGAMPRTPENLARALSLAEEVVLAAPYDEIARCELAWALTNLGRHAEAVEHLRRAIELNPVSPNARADLAEQLVLLGHAAEALEEVQHAFALSRYDPLEVWRHNTMALACFVLGEYAEALEVCRHLVRAEPAFVRGVVNWAAAAAAMDLNDEASRAIDHLARLAPGLRISTLSPTYASSFVDPEHQARLLQMLRKAGLSE